MRAFDGRCRPQITGQITELVLHSGTRCRAGRPLTAPLARVVLHDGDSSMLRKLALIAATALALAALFAAAMLPEPETNAPDGCSYPLVRCNR